MSNACGFVLYLFSQFPVWNDMSSQLFSPLTVSVKWQYTLLCFIDASSYSLQAIVFAKKHTFKAAWKSSKALTRWTSLNPVYFPAENRRFVYFRATALVKFYQSEISRAPLTLSCSLQGGDGFKNQCDIWRWLGAENISFIPQASAEISNVLHTVPHRLWHTQLPLSHFLYLPSVTFASLLTLHF